MTDRQTDRQTDKFFDTINMDVWIFLSVKFATSLLALLTGGKCDNGEALLICQAGLLFHIFTIPNIKLKPMLNSIYWEQLPLEIFSLKRL